MRSPSSPPIAIGLAVALGCACGEGGLLIPEGGPGEGESESESEDEGGATCEPDEALALFEPERLARIDLTFDPGWLDKSGHEADDWGAPGTCAEREDEGCPGGQGWLWDYWCRCPDTGSCAETGGRRWAPVTFRYRHGGKEVELDGVGLRFRGGYPDVEAGDRNGFKINFDPDRDPDAAGARQRFHGLNILNVLSLDPDFSLVKQCLSYRLADDFGIPAPRCNHVEVYVEGEYYGVLPHVEERDDMRYLCHRFGHSSEQAGELFAARTRDCGADPNTLDYRGDSYADYAEAYDIESLQDGEDPETAAAPLVGMIGCMQEADGDEFGACVRDWIDLDEWLHVIAFEAVLPAVEAMSGSSRNFYLYFDPHLDGPHQGRFQLYLWDMDIGYELDLCSVWDVDEPGCDVREYDVDRPDDCLGREGEPCDLWRAVPTWARHPPNPFNHRLKQAFRDQYCEAVAEFVRELYTTEHIGDRVDEIRNAIADVIADPERGHPAHGFDQWEALVRGIERDVATRREQVIEQLAADCDLAVE